MRIIRFIDDHDREQLGVDLGGGDADLLDGQLFGKLQRTGKRAEVRRLLAPLRPVNIFCIGLNYKAHARETGAALPEHPVVFMKPTSTVTDPGKPILLPRCSLKGPEVDYECELVVVIGKAARDVAEGEALDYVLGYTAANDVSARHWQKQGGGGQWIRGKSFDSFCPLGPALVTAGIGADEIADPQALALSTTLNGEVMQQSNTADMIFPVAKLVSFLSQDTTLLPGTIILTGTPQGVGFARKPPVYLKAGDEVTIELEKIGRLTNVVREIGD